MQSRTTIRDVLIIGTAAEPWNVFRQKLKRDITFCEGKAAAWQAEVHR
jgi:hypothetical protein